jgi:glycosyltransferase involved in cell wall biosynthesis
MLAILHGYLLEGSGSNLWTRSIIQSLCKNGQTVHLVCQENHPQIYDFITSVYIYDKEGKCEVLFKRKSPWSGRCIMHKPWIGETLPVYVWDKYEEFSDVQPMVQLNDEVINNYLENNIRIVAQIVKENGIGRLHANHAVLMSVVAQRVAAKFNIPFAIMPHGSAIEYAVKKDKRYFDYAYSAFNDASRIYVIGKEIHQRVSSLFPDIENLEDKMTELNLGADTTLFEPIKKSQRAENVKKLETVLQNVPRGKSNAMTSALLKDVNDFNTIEQLKEYIAVQGKYTAKHTDAEAESKLKSINWDTDEIILFIGRLIASKGVHSIITSLPFVFKEYPNAKMVIVGHGPLREPLEILIWALQNKYTQLAQNIIQWARELEGTKPGPLLESAGYLKALENDGKLDDYYKIASETISIDRIIFTGYLTHKELQYIFPAGDVAVFPSVVAEAGPLVFLEAIASGCFPIGTYFAGMAASIDSIRGSIADKDLDYMKLSPDAAQTVSDMVQRIRGALALKGKHSAALRKVAVERYDWSSISKRFYNDLEGLDI